MALMRGCILNACAALAVSVIVVSTVHADGQPAPEQAPAASVVAPTQVPAGPSAPAAGPAAPAATPASESEQLGKTLIRRNRDAAAAEPGTPGEPPAPAPSFDLGRVTLALTAVLGLILFLRWGSRKFFSLPVAGTSPHIMRVVARSPIAPRQNVLLLRVGQRLVIVGDSGGRLSALGEITNADEIATILGQAKSNTTTPPANFGGILRKLSRKFRGMEPGEITEEDTGDGEDGDSRQERQSLLGGLPLSEPDPAAAAATKAAIDASESKVGLDDAAAEAAVEAARRDVQALREKLREVSQRMAVGSATTEAAKETPAPPAAGAA